MTQVLLIVLCALIIALAGLGLNLITLRWIASLARQSRKQQVEIEGILDRLRVELAFLDKERR